VEKEGEATKKNNYNNRRKKNKIKYTKKLPNFDQKCSFGSIGARYIYNV
jgi:hypothetical protein